ncbi:copper chaperone CopZ [Bacillus sp. SLBN-46]|uniref:heavy-metal-associated domain-containing protein n=1 Tax=Bacillus sp. SLBN-46 TaxID=3042283 RepID=UPI0028552B45|nr:heavy metal-associated domain-containing protein [Bacillus sp. SLBN-46]MDR6124946.1 copper chaperone CopZ [Bacillus sp. SLBN-46]
MSMIELALNDVACTGCMGKIKRRIEKITGVEQVKILSGTGKVQIKFNKNHIQIDEINQTIHKLTLRSFD